MSKKPTFETVTLVISRDSETGQFNFNTILPNGCYQSGTRGSLQDVQTLFMQKMKNEKLLGQGEEPSIESYLKNAIHDFVDHDLLRFNFSEQEIGFALDQGWITLKIRPKGAPKGYTINV